MCIYFLLYLSFYLCCARCVFCVLFYIPNHFFLCCSFFYNFNRHLCHDGITNRMIQAAGLKFKKILFEVFSMLWVHEIQPAARQMSLMQPIYKGGDKSKAEPASYRGIYLSSAAALAKLFERILISRLTKFSETHITLTENQLGTCSGRQIYDAIYCLLFIIQYNISQKGLATYVAFCDFSTAFPSIH